MTFSEINIPDKKVSRGEYKFPFIPLIQNKIL